MYYIRAQNYKKKRRKPYIVQVFPNKNKEF